MQIKKKALVIFITALILILIGVMIMKNAENANGKSTQVLLTTTQGNIIIELDSKMPVTAGNFETLVNKGFYDGIIFHRVIFGFMIQGGDPTGTGSGGPGYKFEDELNPATASYQAGYKKGVVAMANAGPNTNGSQFFIVTAAAALWLDGKHTIFGRVVAGMEVVKKIEGVTTGVGDRPVTDVVLEKVIIER